jgi:hypothetical protein
MQCRRRSHGLGSGGGKGFDAAGTIAGSKYQANQVDAQSDADFHASVADAHKIQRDKLNERVDDAKRMLEKVLEFVKEMNGTRNATLQTAASFKG